MTGFAWTATEGYQSYPPYANLTGNRLTVRGPEVFNGKYYEPGPHAVIELPPEALAELAQALTHQETQG